MKKSAKVLWQCLTVGFVALFLATAKATTVIPPTFEEMTDKAELIFVGKVTGSRAEWRSAGVILKRNTHISLRRALVSGQDMTPLIGIE